MGGQVLEYEAKNILRQGKLETFFELVRDGIIKASEAASRSSMTEEDFLEKMKKAGY